MTSAEPASDEALASIAHAAQRYVDHVRPTSGEDLWAMNITSWMGERMPYVVARLAQAEQKLARLTEQSDLWHRGDLDTTTAMAGVYGELHGMPLPEVGEWDRARAAEQAAREQAAAQPDEGHCPKYLRFPCGHCAHDLCPDCSRCCTCQCAAEAEMRAEQQWTPEEERDLEARLDAADEERWADEAAADPDTN